MPRDRTDQPGIDLPNRDSRGTDKQVGPPCGPPSMLHSAAAAPVRLRWLNNDFAKPRRCPGVAEGGAGAHKRQARRIHSCAANSTRHGCAAETPQNREASDRNRGVPRIRCLDQFARGSSRTGIPPARCAPCSRLSMVPWRREMPPEWSFTRCGLRAGGRASAWVCV